MFKKRIILSDDEDEQNSSMQSDANDTLSTPSTKLAATLSTMQMSAPRKPSTIQKSKETVKNNDEECFSSDNELDAELTRKVMQGHDSENSGDEAQQSPDSEDEQSRRLSSSGRPSRSSAVKAQEKLRSYYHDGDVQSSSRRRDSDHSGGEEDSDSDHGDADRCFSSSKTPHRRAPAARPNSSKGSSSRYAYSDHTTPGTSSSSTRAPTAAESRSSRSSARCRAVNGRQNARREAVLDELQRKSRSGLSGALQSTDDEDDEDEGNGEQGGEGGRGGGLEYVGSSSTRKAVVRQQLSSAWGREVHRAVVRRDEQEGDDDYEGE